MNQITPILMRLCKPLAILTLITPQLTQAERVVVAPNELEYILAESPAIKAGDKSLSHRLQAEVQAFEVVSLVVDSEGSKHYDWANWVDLYFTDADGVKTPVTKEMIAWESQGWGALGDNTNVGGKPIQLGGKLYEQGFGVHAPSTVQLSVPKGSVSLSATGALDEGNAVVNGKPTAAKVSFRLVNEGGKRASGAGAIPASAFTTSSEELEVTLWAETPMLYNPTNMDVDAHGRIWVAEGVNYRRKAGRRPEGDRILVLEDTNQDGKADKSTVFLQSPGLNAPLGVSVFDNKVVIPNPPHLVVYTDVNRNLVFEEGVDTVENLLTGFNASQHDHGLHSVTHGPDGKWYFNVGNCGAIFQDRSGKTFNMNGVYRGGGGVFHTDNHKLGGQKSDDGYLWTSGFGVRVNPDGTNAEITGHGFRNSYEHAVNSLGDLYQNDNDDYGSCRNSYILEYGSAGYFTRDGQQTWREVSRPGQPTGEAHWRQADPGTFEVGDIYGQGSPTGNVFYENGALGDEWIGTYLACEAARNVVFGYQPKPKGASFSMERFDFLTSNTSGNFIGGDQTKRIENINEASSKSILFRPSDVAIGTDGAIYVTDWYDGRVGGHSTIDDDLIGAIYRIAPKGFKSTSAEIDYTTTEGQLTALASPAVNVRHVGFHNLKAQGAAVYEQVAELLEHPNKYVAARAVYLLPYLGEKGLTKAESLLKSPEAETRLTAYRALRRAGGNMLTHAQALAQDSDAGVRRDVALSLRHYSAAETQEIFVDLARGYDGADKNYLEALGLGAENKEGAIWKHLKAGLDETDPTVWSESFAKITWRLWTSEALADWSTRASAPNVSQVQKDFAIEAISFINDQAAAEALLELGNDDQLKASVVYWLLKRSRGAWKQFKLGGELKKRGIYDPAAIQVSGVEVPAPAKRTYEVEDVMKLTGNAEAGKVGIMRCVMCHKVNGAGPDYGPPLQGWGTTQSREAIIRSIVDPSYDIAHGYKGKELILKDGTKVHGLLFGAGDPAMVMSTSGVTQLIPKGRIKSNNWLPRSLMLSAEQLSLSAQDVADIAAYMQQWK